MGTCRCTRISRLCFILCHSICPVELQDYSPRTAVRIRATLFLTYLQQDALIAARVEQMLFESKLADIRAQQEIKREEQRTDIATTLVYLRALKMPPFGRDVVKSLQKAKTV